MSHHESDKKNTSTHINDTSTIVKKNTVRIRWRRAFEKIKMKQLFHNNEMEHQNDQSPFLERTGSNKLSGKIMALKSNKKNVLSILTQNIIAQKFANILKKQFKSLSAKQYKIINDICYNDVDEDIKRRQKLKKRLEENFLNVADKETKKQLKRQLTKSQKLISQEVGSRDHKHFQRFSAFLFFFLKKNFEGVFKFFRFISRVYLPDGFFRVSFDITAMFLIVWELIQIPILLSFQDINPDPILDYFSTFITSFFLTDLILNFNTAFYERGHIVTERSEIFKHYLKGWFSIDLLSSFPYDMVIDPLLEAIYDSNTDSPSAKSFSQGTRLLRILQFIKFLRVLRLLRALKLKKIFGKLEDYLQLTPTFNAFLALIRLSFLIVCIAHWCACGFHLVATFEDTMFPMTWIRMLRLENEDWSTRYITSIYWALTTMTTIGYGDVTPVTNPEKIYVMIMMILSSGVFGYTMSRIGSILQSFNETNLEYKVQMFQINKYMKRKNVPKELQARVRKYIEYTLDPDKTNQIDEKKLFEALSKNLMDEITVFINGNIIKQYEFLYKIFSPGLLFKISFNLHEFIYGPEEIIVSENVLEEDPAIYFLTSGIVTVYNQNSNVFFFILKDGCYFGEISFFSNIRRTASVKSSDFISVYKLRRSDFWNVITRENLREDHEMFCHLKDKLELYKDHLLLNLMCYSCNCSGHVVKNCPEVHYIPKPDLVIKAQLEIEKKARKEFKRRTKKYQAKIQVPLILTSAYAIRNTMFLYHEEGIKERYRVEDDMNDFLEENPKGMESLAKKIVNYKEANAFQAEKSNVRFEVQNLISKTLEEDMEQNDEEEYLKSLHSLKKPQKVIEYDAFFNDFERIDIFTKYFIHNNFTIIKKKLTHELTIKMNEKKRRQSFQKKVQLLKSKTIRPGKKIEVSEDDPSASGLPEEFKMDIVTMDLKVGFKDFSENLNRQELKDPNSRELFETSPSILALNNNYSTLKFENSKTKKNLNKKTTKRASSVETAKECEKFIEKFGAENVYKLVKDKIDKKE